MVASRICIRVIESYVLYVLQRATASNEKEAPNGLPKIPSGSLGTFKNGMESVIKKVRCLKVYSICLNIVTLFCIPISDSTLFRAHYGEAIT